MKPHEIALLVLGITLPTVFFVLAFIPGGLNLVVDFLLDPRWRNWLFYSGAALTFAVLSWRIYRRIRPRQKKPEPKTPHVSPTKMPKV